MSNFVFIVLLAQGFPLSACKSHSAAKGIICCLQFTLEDFRGSIGEVAANFFPPLPHRRRRKKIAPHICLRGYWFWNCVISTSASISLGQHDPLKPRERKQLGTEPEPDSGDQSRHSPLFHLKESAPVLAAVANFSLKRESSHIFNGKKAFKHCPLNISVTAWNFRKKNSLYHTQSVSTSCSFSWDLAKAHSVLGWGIHWKKELGSVVSIMPQGWQSLLDADVALNLLRDVSLRKKNSSRMWKG